MDSTLNLIPGMTAEVGIIMDVEPGGRGLGSFAYLKDSVNHMGETKPVVNGWVVTDPNVGTITACAGKPAVMYKHMRPEKNSLLFFNGNGALKASVHIIAVPIHDHSSIVQGGPAYATYFSDDESIE